MLRVAGQGHSARYGLDDIFRSKECNMIGHASSIGLERLELASRDLSSERAIEFAICTFVAAIPIDAPVRIERGITSVTWDLVGGI